MRLDKKSVKNGIEWLHEAVDFFRDGKNDRGFEAFLNAQPGVDHWEDWALSKKKMESPAHDAAQILHVDLKKHIKDLLKRSSRDFPPTGLMKAYAKLHKLYPDW